MPPGGARSAEGAERVREEEEGELRVAAAQVQPQVQRADRQEVHPQADEVGLHDARAQAAGAPPARRGTLAQVSPRIKQERKEFADKLAAAYPKLDVHRDIDIICDNFDVTVPIDTLVRQREHRSPSAAREGTTCCTFVFQRRRSLQVLQDPRAWMPKGAKYVGLLSLSERAEAASSVGPPRLVEKVHKASGAPAVE
jgi:hypothetical protein